MNVVKLNRYLSNNIDAIEQILYSIGCEKIKYNSSNKTFRCSRAEGKNPSAVVINVETLKFICFSTDEKGSIYNLIMNKLLLSFPEALYWTATLLGLDKREFVGEIKYPFGGFYKKLTSNIEEPEMNMNKISKSELDKYGLVSSLKFYNDGIDFITQNSYGLGYDCMTDRITIPEWDLNGNLVGIMGRSNDPNIDYDQRWLPIIPCSRSYTLYGYHMNYADIQRRQRCYITESEKGPMQLATMGLNNGLATCTKSISKTQEKYIKALRVDEVVLAYDQGLEEEYIRHEAEKLRINNHIYKNKVGYIFDKNGDILKGKDSPTDLGIKNFKKLINEYVVWI